MDNSDKMIAIPKREQTPEEIERTKLFAKEVRNMRNTKKGEKVVSTYYNLCDIIYKRECYVIEIIYTYIYI